MHREQENRADEEYAIRATTELVALTTARAGLSDSAAAMVAISAPTIEKITTHDAGEYRTDPQREEPTDAP